MHKINFGIFIRLSGQQARAILVDYQPKALAVALHSVVRELCPVEQFPRSVTCDSERIASLPAISRILCIFFLYTRIIYTRLVWLSFLRERPITSDSFTLIQPFSLMSRNVLCFLICSAFIHFCLPCSKPPLFCLYFSTHSLKMQSFTHQLSTSDNDSVPMKKNHPLIEQQNLGRYIYTITKYTSACVF